VFARTPALVAPWVVVAAPTGNAVVLGTGATPIRSAVPGMTMDVRAGVAAHKAQTVVQMVVVATRGATAITVPHTTTPSGAAQTDRSVLEGNRIWHCGFEDIFTRAKSFIPYIRGHCATSLL